MKNENQDKYAVHYDTDLDRMVTYNQLDMVIPIKEVYIDQVKCI